MVGFRWILTVMEETDSTSFSAQRLGVLVETGNSSKDRDSRFWSLADSVCRAIEETASIRDLGRLASLRRGVQESSLKKSMRLNGRKTSWPLPILADFSFVYELQCLKFNYGVKIFRPQLANKQLSGNVELSTQKVQETKQVLLTLGHFMK